MPRYSIKRSSNFGNSVWQQKGTSLSLKNALLEYNVTEKQLIDAKIPLQWRSCYGNSFPVFQRADVEMVVRMNSGGLAFEISQATTQLNNKRKELDVAKASVQSLTCEVDALAHKIEDLKRRDAEAKQQAAAEAAGTQAQEEQTPEKAAEDVPQGYAPVAQEQRREPFNSVAAFLHNQLPVTYSAPQEGPDQKKVKIIAI